MHTSLYDECAHAAPKEQGPFRSAHQPRLDPERSAVPEGKQGAKEKARRIPCPFLEPKPQPPDTHLILILNHCIIDRDSPTLFSTSMKEVVLLSHGSHETKGSSRDGCKVL